MEEMYFPMSAICYSILSALQEGNNNAILKAVTVAAIMEMDDVRGVSSGAVYKAIDVLLGRQFIARGVKVANANTFFITKKGVEHLSAACGE